MHLIGVLRNGYFRRIYSHARTDSNRYKTVSRSLHNRFTTATQPFHDCFTSVTQSLPNRFTSATQPLHNCFTAITQPFHIRCTNISRPLHIRSRSCTTHRKQTLSLTLRMMMAWHKIRRPPLCCTHTRVIRSFPFRKETALRLPYSHPVFRLFRSCTVRFASDPDYITLP